MERIDAPVAQLDRALASEARVASSSLAGRTILRSLSMADEHANTDSAINDAVSLLKSKIPPADHAALESRVQDLINDPETDDADVISILRQEFDPESGFAKP